MSFNIETYKDYTIFWSMADYCIVKDGVILATSNISAPLGAPKEYIDTMILKQEEYNRGYTDGYAEGFQECIDDYETEKESSYRRGYDDGKAQGRVETLAQSESFKGYDEGFRAGEVVGRAESEHKIIELTNKIEVLEILLSDRFSDIRPQNCRNRLESEGKSHPKSGCDAYGCGGVLNGGCIYEKHL